ncbi:MAG TPA: hypothetical protein VFQ52_11685 [Rhizomicrobium sp.]|nr:hypothetical protein [Rhizomicrobium sp.]
MKQAAKPGGLYRLSGRFNADRRFEYFIPVCVQHCDMPHVVTGHVDPNLNSLEIGGCHRGSIVDAEHSDGIDNPAAVFHIKIIARHEALHRNQRAGGLGVPGIRPNRDISRQRKGFLESSRIKAALNAGKDRPPGGLLS